MQPNHAQDKAVDDQSAIHIYFLITPEVHLLDLAGPIQAFHEAQLIHSGFVIHFVSFDSEVMSRQGMGISGLTLPPAELPPHSIVIACASRYRPDIYTDPASQKSIMWLKNVPREDTTLASLCTGAFLLGKAGWLDGRECTTHHTLTAQLQRDFPKANVVSDRIHVKSGMVSTSAGVTAGIDLCLDIIENRAGAYYSIAVARELVVCRRRMANDPQISNHLSFRNHISPFIHSVQDYIACHFNEKLSLARLSSQFRVSQRHLQRLFKTYTGMTVRDYIAELRLEEAKHIINRGETIERAAHQAGFNAAASLRSAWKRKYYSLPSQTSTG
jgi:transcriptional regulator GlxA family with amidase domain